MSNRLRSLTAAVFLVLSEICQAEVPVVELTLDDAIALARANSVDAAVAVNELRSAYWEYRSFRADLLPEVKLTATLPAYSRQFNSYQQSDGSYTFLRNDNLLLSGTLSLDQRIWLTGGTVSLTTSLDFRRQLSGETGNRFMSVPAALRLTQPLFGFNDVKWSRRIEPIRYSEAKAAYISETESVAMTAIRYFFDLIEARNNTASARTNTANAEKMLEVARAKRRMGIISENDLMQIELNKLNSESSLMACTSDEKSAMFRLRSFLGLSDKAEINVRAPGIPDIPDVDYADALRLASDNNSFALSIRRRQLEADKEVATAKGNMREINLFAQIGLTGTDSRFKESYGNLRNNQIVEIGVSLPIVDWGKRRGRVKVAQSNRELMAARLVKEQADFDQNLFILVERFNNQQRQVRIAAKADTLASMRYESSVSTFMTGRIAALDLNDSQSGKDSARSKYISEVFYFWYYYYQLRSLTLWDFATHSPIEADFMKAIGR